MFWNRLGITKSGDLHDRFVLDTTNQVLTSRNPMLQLVFRDKLNEKKVFIFQVEDKQKQDLVLET